MTYRFKIISDEKVLDEETKVIREGIVNFNAPFLGSKPDRYSVVVKDENNITLGGAVVYAHPKSVYVDVLWVHEKHRCNGLGKEILQMVEKEAENRNIMQCTLDTFAFQAEKFYLKQGYEKIGVIPDYIEGYDRIYLRKQIR